MTMFQLKTLPVVLTLFLCLLVDGCGKDVVVPYSPSAPAPVTPSTTGTGNWVFDPVVNPNTKSPYFYFFGGSLTNNGGQLSGVLHVNAPCFGSNVDSVSYTGTLDNNNHLSLVSNPIGGQILMLQGTLSSDASTLNNLTFSIAGGCTGNISGGTLVANSTTYGTGLRIPSFTGTWTTGAPPAGGLTNLSFTEQLTQSPTPDANGDYALSGIISIQGSPCFTKGSLQPGSYISGYLGHEIYLMDDGSTVDISMEVEYVLDVFQLNQLSLSPVIISGGGCDGQIPTGFLLTALN